MGAADLARTHRRRPTAQHGHRRRPLMRGPERWPSDQSAGRNCEPGRRVNSSSEKRLLSVKVREQADEPAGQHCLPRARRPDHQQMMTTGGADFEGPAGERLTPEFGQISGRSIAVGAR